MGVKGRLKQCISYWESTVCASGCVLDVISEGYRLPFISFPERGFISSNCSAPCHPQFVQEDLPGPGQKVFYRGKLSVFIDCPKFCMLALRVDFRLALPTRKFSFVC